MFLNHSKPRVIGTESLDGPRANRLGKAVWPASFRDLPVPALIHQHQGSKRASLHLAFMWVPGRDPNSGPHDSAALTQ